MSFGLVIFVSVKENWSLREPLLYTYILYCTTTITLVVLTRQYLNLKCKVNTFLLANSAMLYLKLIISHQVTVRNIQ